MARDSFNIDDLKSGMVVELKSGRLMMVTRVGSFTKILIDENGAWSYLSRWGSDLKRKSVYSDCRPSTSHCGYETILPRSEDIVRVYGLVEGTENYWSSLGISTKGRKVLWTRVVPKRMTLEEIEKSLGFPVEIVSG